MLCENNKKRFFITQDGDILDLEDYKNFDLSKWLLCTIFIIIFFNLLKLLAFKN